VSLDPEGWLPITVGQPEWMSTFVLYGTEEGWEQLKRKDFSVDEHRTRAAGLGQTVRKIHAHFLRQRRAQAATGNPSVMRRQPIRNADKVGRNDPCPCGSGKKYKHCHGSSQALH
jgi:uncharacterized protein